MLHTLDLTLGQNAGIDEVFLEPIRDLFSSGQESAAVVSGVPLLLTCKHLSGRVDADENLKYVTHRAADLDDVQLVPCDSRSLALIFETLPAGPLCGPTLLVAQLDFEAR